MYYYRGLSLIGYTDTTKNTYAYLKNAHGDITGTVNASGRVSASFDYDAYGNKLTSQANPTPFGYSGEYYDAETGMIYLRARYYDPSTSRFISEDPIRDGVNWYAYCTGNPVNFVDPSGLAIWLIHGTNLFNKPNPQYTWTNEFREYISEQFDDESVEEGNWSGGNSVKVRKEGAEKIYKEIKEYMEENPNEPIRLIGHSHGGNVAILVTNLLHTDGYEVKNLVTIATPVREYNLNKGVYVGQHVNVYSTIDMVQTMGGSIWNFGAAKRTFSESDTNNLLNYNKGPIASYGNMKRNTYFEKDRILHFGENEMTFRNVTNIDATKNISSKKSGPIASHSAVHSDLDIWKEIIWPEIIK